MRMSKKRLKYYYYEYLMLVAKSYWDDNKSSFMQFLNGHNYGMLSAYGYSLGYDVCKIESDLYREKQLYQNMLERIANKVC